MGFEARHDVNNNLTSRPSWSFSRRKTSCVFFPRWGFTFQKTASCGLRPPRTATFLGMDGHFFLYTYLVVFIVKTTVEYQFPGRSGLKMAIFVISSCSSFHKPRLQLVSVWIFSLLLKNEMLINSPCFSAVFVLIQLSTLRGSAPPPAVASTYSW